jgi:Zn-dependent protease
VSLCLFNLLPLPFLDGSQLLSALLAIWAGRQSNLALEADDVELYDAEMGGRASHDGGDDVKDRRRYLWAKRITATARLVTSGQLVLLAVLGGLTWLQNHTI